MRPKPKEAKIRINLVVRQSVKDQVERLKESTGADTMTEVIRRALDVYEALTDKIEEGSVLVIAPRRARDSER